MSGTPVRPAVRVLAGLWVALIALELAALGCWLVMGGPWYDLLALDTSQLCAYCRRRRKEEF